MRESEWLAGEFEKNRSHLRAVAYRMLGSAYEADDAVQETWLRLSRSDAGKVENLKAWLTTVVARICLDMLRSRNLKREEPLELPDDPLPAAPEEEEASPEHETLMADSVGLAMLAVLDTLPPAERVAFVLHDVFDMAFEEIAAVVGRSPAAARQLASRARRRVRGAAPAAMADSDRRRQRRIVDAFLAASRDGDFEALLALLDPAVVLRADEVAVRLSAARAAQGAFKLAPEIRGAAAVAETFKGKARAAQPALINGALGFVWAPGGQPRAVFLLAISGERITGIDLIADPERIRELEIELH